MFHSAALIPDLRSSRYLCCQQVFLGGKLGKNCCTQIWHAGDRVEAVVNLKAVFSMPPQAAQRLLDAAERMLQAWQSSYLQVTNRPAIDVPSPSSHK